MEQLEREFNGREYTRSPENLFWKPRENGHPFICLCGGREVTLHFADTYQLDATCMSCGNTDEVYSG